MQTIQFNSQDNRYETLNQALAHPLNSWHPVFVPWSMGIICCHNACQEDTINIGNELIVDLGNQNSLYIPPFYPSNNDGNTINVLQGRYKSVTTGATTKSFFDVLTPYVGIRMDQQNSVHYELARIGIIAFINQSFSAELNYFDSIIYADQPYTTLSSLMSKNEFRSAFPYLKVQSEGRNWSKIIPFTPPGKKR